MHLAWYSPDLWAISARAEGNGSSWKGTVARRCEQKDGIGSEGAQDTRLKRPREI